MKLFHIADLHIGKRVNEFNMVEDQRAVLEQILQMTKESNPEGILISGDVYDKSQPSVEAVELLDEFLTRLAEMAKPVFLISGNHDSPERLGFGSRILQKNRIHIGGVFEGSLKKVSLQDEHGVVNIYLLPFLKPAMVRPYIEQPVETYDEAVRAVLSTVEINTQERNLLLAHQFVVDGVFQPERSESENLSVGGLDNVDASAFDAFDYVALGHLHRPQKIGRDTIRYAGSPLKYSFSEVHHQKSVTLLELGGKGEIIIQQIPLKPLRDLREIKGPIAELLRVGKKEAESADDYIHAILTDEEEIYDAIGQLRQVYPNMMGLDFENSHTRKAMDSENEISADVVQKDPMELFSEFYQMQSNSTLTPEQIRVMERIFEQAGGVGS